MAPAILTTLQSHLSSRAPDPSALGPLAARAVLLARDDNKEADSESGILTPDHINNNALFALFGIIGAAIVCVGIWFFFWARNGGFYFKETDWDDYKTTVLRRRGPNGTLLTGATPSTRLGGGSVYKDVDDDGGDATTVVTATTDSTGLTGITGGVSDFAGREKRRRKRAQKEREKERRRADKAAEKKSRRVNGDGVLVDEEAEAEAQAHLRNYRHEKPARVGGINKESDGSAWDGSTNPSHSAVSSSEPAAASSYYSPHQHRSSKTDEGGSEVTSELMSNRERTPTSTPTKPKAAGGGIRKVYSAAERTAERESERIRAEAKRLQEKGRAAAASSAGKPKRDFSWKRSDDSTGLPRIEESGSGKKHQSVPGSWNGSDVGYTERPDTSHGTKSYRCVIPGLSPSAGGGGGAGSEISGTASDVGSTAVSDFAYQEEKRKRRGGAGYRRAARE